MPAAIDVSNMLDFYLCLDMNHDPRANIVRTVTALLDVSPEIDASRVIMTSPADAWDKGFYLSLVARVRTSLDASKLAWRMRAIETALRDQQPEPPDSTINLAILFALPPDAAAVDAGLLPTKSHVRPIPLELFDYLGLQCDARSGYLPSGVDLHIGQAMFGRLPTTLRRDERNGEVRNAAPYTRSPDESKHLGRLRTGYLPAG